MRFFDQFIKFLKEVRVEIRKVNWPSRDEAVRYTAFVIGFSALLAMFLGLLDFIYITILRNTILQ